MLLAAGGMMLGLAAGAALAQIVKTLLFAVRPVDPAVYVGVALLFGVVAFVACLVPSWRAARVDPLVALGRG
jgi:putative ABC transport system permease protein